MPAFMTTSNDGTGNRQPTRNILHQCINGKRRPDGLQVRDVKSKATRWTPREVVVVFWSCSSNPAA
jgi:hypothetical protein